MFYETQWRRAEQLKQTSSQRENGAVGNSDNQYAFEASHTLIPPRTTGYEADELMFSGIIALFKFCSLA